MDWSFNTIWFDQIDQAKVSDLRKHGTAPSDLEGKEYVILWHYKQPNGSLDHLPASPSVRYLELNLGGTASLIGLERFPSLRRLEVHRCTKLKSDVGLARLSRTLRHLHINTCKKFVIEGELLDLVNLEVLSLNACGDLPDLGFLERFPRLQAFRFVNTNVTSGDLSPLLRHKTLKDVGFLAKRHFSHRPEEIEIALAAKRADPYKEFAHKGPWTTFRYIESAVADDQV